MGRTENPNRQIGYLQQCLSSDKRPLSLFLGAGCPVAVKEGDGGKIPLIQDIAGITRQVCDELEKCPDCGPLLNVVETHFKTDGRCNTTVEDILSHVRALRVVAGKDEVRGLSADDLDILDDRVCKIIHKVVDKVLPASITPYHQVASWINAAPRDYPIEIFTTNYDLLMEQAFDDYHVPYFDGFAGTRKPFFDLRAMEEDTLPPRWARLWKLHGSINWYQTPGNDIFRGDSMGDSGSKRVIYPSHMKYQESRRMPYLAMLDRLRAFLKEPTSTLIVCGYSFRDDHLNEVILQGLEYTPTAIAFVLLFDKISQYPNAVSLALKRSNLSILARDGGVINSQECIWPEKDAGSVSGDNSDWVKWSPIIPGDTDSKLSAEFLLGDFDIFGQFLAELVGSVRIHPEHTHAK